MCVRITLAIGCTVCVYMPDVCVQNVHQENYNYYQEMATEPTRCTVTMDGGRGSVPVVERGLTKQPMWHVNNWDL